MAKLEIDNNELVLQLSNIEKIEAVHGDLRVPINAVQDIKIIEDARKVMTGISIGFKVGMRVPGIACVATIRRPKYKGFIVIHHKTPRAVQIVLKDNDYNEWIVGAIDPGSTIAQLKVLK